MSERKPAQVELSALLRLTAPLAILQLSYTAIGASSTAIVGRLGEVPLSAVGLGNALYFGITVVGLGLIMGFDPLIAQALGADEEEDARSLFWQAIWLSLFISVPLTLGVLALAFFLPYSGIDEGSVSDTRDYLIGRVFSLWPFLLTAAARSYLQARERIRSLIVAAVLSNVVNLPVCWVLTHGDPGLVQLGLPAIGAPALGVFGAGLSFTAAGIVMAIVMLVDAVPSLRIPRPDVPAMLRGTKIGAPLAGQLFAEVGVFSVITFIIGYLGPRALAAHHIALTIASTAFQVSLAIGAAAAVRVGRAIGREDPVATRRSGIVALQLGVVYTVGTSFLFWLLPEPLARIFTSDGVVIAAALPLIFVAAAFQIGDGVQTIAAGALRGAGDTRVTFVANVFGHYAIGLPIGILLAFVFEMGAAGLWWGLSAGLSAVGVLLSWRFHRLSRGKITRS